MMIMFTVYYHLFILRLYTKKIGAGVLTKYYRLAVKAWPSLKYTNVKKEQRGSILKIGIVSAFFI